MTLRTRLRQLEERAREYTRTHQHGWRYVMIFDGVEPTPEQRKILEYNRSVKGKGVGFRSITIVHQRGQRADTLWREK